MSRQIASDFCQPYELVTSQGPMINKPDQVLQIQGCGSFIDLIYLLSNFSLFLLPLTFPSINDCWDKCELF